MTDLLEVEKTIDSMIETAKLIEKADGKSDFIEGYLKGLNRAKNILVTYCAEAVQKMEDEYVGIEEAVAGSE